MSYNENLFYGASPLVLERARELRKKMTHSESLFWNEVSNKNFLGFKFRRQHPIGNFIVDFYCHELKLVIEIDGDIHESNDSKEYDEGRTYELEELGLQVLRFQNEEVEKEMEKVLFVLRSKVISLTTP
ncbi:endonuclease domain-containing protein [Shivajiella indica]|uniref:Endonuclease domain-containing protein n=1 Tax=Shivajiella indica TaxID=872115 RepID=A0ABW5BEJ1_9BACT